MLKSYKNKKIVIMGLGINEKGSGISSALFFVRRGANLLITDLRKETDLKKQIKKLDKVGLSKNIKYVLGRHRKKDFEKADFIFKNPSVPKSSPYLKIARKNKIPIINDWSIFFEERPENLLIGITGTKGKSFTATLIYETLKNFGMDVVLCGNIGKSPLAILNKIRPAFQEKKGTVVVAELSSWLLQEFKTIKRSPQIAIITNLMPDHLDKYNSLKDYYRDKENIFRFQKKNNYIILNKDDVEVQKFAKKAIAKVIWFSGNKDKNGAIIAVAKLLGVPKKIIEKTIESFKGIPHRLEFIREKNGVKFINDSASTVPNATIYALASLIGHKGKVVLIAGGDDKKLNYKDFTKKVKENVKELILFSGSATDKIIKENIQNSYNLIIHIVDNMKDAVMKAKNLAKRGDVVLLSPGATSFNSFKNEFDRGNQFTKLVNKM